MSAVHAIRSLRNLISTNLKANCYWDLGQTSRCHLKRVRKIKLMNQKSHWSGLAYEDCIRWKRRSTINLSYFQQWVRFQHACDRTASAKSRKCFRLGGYLLKLASNQQQWLEWWLDCSVKCALFPEGKWSLPIIISVFLERRQSLLVVMRYKCESIVDRVVQRLGCKHMWYKWLFNCTFTFSWLK